ncbi:hypothetical protein [Brevundimonas sp.]|uniref:hypothetical protein n=1 Tax=Brevundimonas sp. TaxID=1871086 RepID=UPI002FC586C5
MRPLPALVSAFALCGLAVPVLAQTAPARPRIAVVVVTLDQVRQIQLEHGLSTLASLGDAEWGRFTLAEPVLAPDVFASCKDERAEGKLDYCTRFYLTRAELAADAPPTVVVAFDDRPAEARTRHGDEMRVTCYGRGVLPADAAAQDTWLWPHSAHVHGVNAWNRDRDALEACIKAAASEAWTGLRQPDPS